MNETQPALVNFTVETFSNERDMEFHLAQGSKRFEVFMPRFKEAGLKKITSTKILNKEGKAMVGWGTRTLQCCGKSVSGFGYFHCMPHSCSPETFEM